MGNTFLRPESQHLRDRCADAAYCALQEGGAEAITLGVIGRLMRMSPSGLHRAIGGRDGLVVTIIRVFGDRWCRWTVNPFRMDGDILPLPATDDEVAAVRVWATLCELALAESRAGRPEPLARVTSYRNQELGELSSRLTQAFGRRPTAEEIVSVRAMVEGLRSAIAAPGSRITVGGARQILATHVAQLRVAGAAAAQAAARSGSEGGGFDEAGSVPGDQAPADEFGLG